MRNMSDIYIGAHFHDFKMYYIREKKNNTGKKDEGMVQVIIESDSPGLTSQLQGRIQNFQIEGAQNNVRAAPKTV